MHSFRAYRKDRVRESADALAAEAEQLAVENEVAQLDGPDAVRAGRPQDPRD